MTNLKIQNFIFRKPAQKPQVSPALDRPHSGTILQRINCFMFDIKPGDPACMVMGMGMGTFGITGGGFDAANFIKDTLKKFPPANQESIESALAAKLTPDQIVTLFGKIVEKGWMAGNIFETLPAALGAVKGISTPDQIVDLFVKIVESCGWKAKYAFNAVPAALEAKLTPDQIVDLFSKIVEKCGDSVGDTFKALPAALEAKLTTDQIVDLFVKIVESCGWKAEYAFNAVPAALEAKLTPDQIVDLFGRIAVVEESNRAGAFFPLPAALKAKLTPDQIVDLFRKIVEKCGERSINIFKGLPATLEAANGTLTSDEIVDRFSKIVEKCGRYTDRALKALTVAIESKQTPDKIVDLFGRILEECGLRGVDFWGGIVEKYGFRGTDSAFRALPAALEAKLTSDKIIDLFGKIVEKCGRYIIDAFRALPAALKAKLTPDQIVDLFGQKVELGWNTPAAKQAIFNFLKTHLGITEESLTIAEKLHLESEVAFLLNDPVTPQEQIKDILKLARNLIAKSWSKILNKRPPEELPRVFEFCASVMAEKALFALDKINTIASQIKKPTFTVYILSTAYKLKIERFSDQLREQGYSEKEIYKLERSFYAEVEKKAKKGKNHTKARMEVGKEWIEKGLLSRFTQPLFIKIPSSYKPTAKTAKKLRELANLAEKNNWDIIFVDHSTVRTKDVIHRGDPSDYDKGRAIARGLDIVDPKGIRGKWLFKLNGWSIPELDPSHPNIIGLNLYDGLVYESHVGGNKSAWLPVDDHGEFVGISWDIKGRVERTNYIVITRNGDGKYHVSTAEQIFNRLLAESVAKLKKAKEKIRISASNILFVCNANHDRSPLAEHLMRRLINHGVADADKISVSSAGLAVDPWLESEGPKKEFPYLPSSGTRRLLEQREIDYKAFKKCQIDRSAVEHSDIIFVMTKREKKVLLERFPQAKGKVSVLREYAGYQEQDWDIHTPKTFNYQTIYDFEEALNRVLQRMSGRK